MISYYMKTWMCRDCGDRMTGLETAPTACRRCGGPVEKVSDVSLKGVQTYLEASDISKRLADMMKEPVMTFRDDNGVVRQETAAEHTQRVQKFVATLKAMNPKDAADMRKKYEDV